MLTTAYLLAWARALLFTQIVEAPLYRAALGVGWGKALAASAVTHPFVWFVFPPLAARFEIAYLPCAIVSELFAWLVEAAFFVKICGVRPGRAIAFSLLANAASVALGQASRALFGLP
ncbi:MAG: hypothetical protein KF819_36810 [Labilithrix sp.]|nr:hypothetical protein [Labilithrix sp.]